GGEPTFRMIACDVLHDPLLAAPAGNPRASEQQRSSPCRSRADVTNAPRCPLRTVRLCHGCGRGTARWLLPRLAARATRRTLSPPNRAVENTRSARARLRATSRPHRSHALSAKLKRRFAQGR